MPSDQVGAVSQAHGLDCTEVPVMLGFRKPSPVARPAPTILLLDSQSVPSRLFTHSLTPQERLANWQDPAGSEGIVGDSVLSGESRVLGCGHALRQGRRVMRMNHGPGRSSSLGLMVICASVTGWEVGPKWQVLYFNKKRIDMEPAK